ncbi:cell division protein FtsZ [Rariglobus hedericola]|uniref:Cell division protein FtsZ n=1 Tax=Rariglobus hedericola TaxID=2597822 RepID=A0A556QEJ3_9BACT|nr:cell division protein FtsZ [Rariglobus hedericola]TSJ75069.1 cell division protein FtsZ [Rariglobus hedericola]
MNPNELPLSHEILTDRTIAIKVVGIGGAGANAVDRLKMENLDRLQMAVINTDHQALSNSPVQDKIFIGASITRGLGAGGDPDLGHDAAEADREKIAAVVKDCDMVFLVAGMGGGTGSGAAPTVAEIAAESGALVIAFVTMPFTFEGGRRVKQAEEGLAALRKVCDAVIPLPNDILLQQAEEGETALDSFARADEWIGRGVKSIWSMLFRTGLINLDFATLRQAFHTRGGKTLFGLGSGSGENAVAEAIEGVKQCPLLATPEFARKADRLLVNIVGGTDLTLPKVNEIMTAVTEQFGRDSHVIMGAVIDEDMQGKVEVVVLGTSDIGGRSGGVRRPSTLARPTRALTPAAARASGELPIEAETFAAAPVTAGKAPATTATAVASVRASNGELPLVTAPVAQDEFSFNEVESRGHFDKTDRNLFEGQDLDVPTYLRKGIKLAL